MNRPHYFILTDQHIAIPCDDIRVLGEWMEDFDKCRVAETFVGLVRISTVFLGIDYAYQGDPILFETMTFADDGEPLGQWRYSTWAEAERGHAEIVALVEIETKVHPAIKGWAWDRSKEPKE
jgi:hypothetical protein